MHVHAHSDVFPFVFRFRKAVISLNAPYRPADLAWVQHSSVSITTHDPHCMGRAICALFHFLFRFNPLNTSGHLVFLFCLTVMCRCTEPMVAFTNSNCKSTGQSCTDSSQIQVETLVGVACSWIAKDKPSFLMLVMTFRR